MHFQIRQRECFAKRTSPGIAARGQIALGLQLSHQLLEGQILVGVSSQTHFAHPSDKLPRSSDLPDRSVRSTRLFTKKPINPSSSARCPVGDRRAQRHVLLAASIGKAAAGKPASKVMNSVPSSSWIAPGAFHRKPAVEARKECGVPQDRSALGRGADCPSVASGWECRQSLLPVRKSAARAPPPETTPAASGEVHILHRQRQGEVMAHPPRTPRRSPRALATSTPMDQPSETMWCKVRSTA